ncbi:hypothetical protein [Phenylobacterium sp.]|jgi:hypothetical protein|uniref:hypothetical protein n=1 Tax=Phenylobacterium sp. TaxID=1871053 RepID=UPI002E342DFD|nr:hypothetical protein [Phenylobacterium sp.]HEX3366250.1 hypothetical protein [Phenylobacterium sp.]
MIDIVHIGSNEPLPSLGDGMIVSRTPSGRWQVTGAAVTGRDEATFLAAQAFNRQSAAIEFAREWGEPRGVEAIYVRGPDDA